MLGGQQQQQRWQRSGGGGTVGCDPSCAAAGGACSGRTCSISENPGNVSTATQTKLQAGGTGDAAFAWRYPYDKTVFPRGLLSPTLQFAGGAADAEYVHITSRTLDYKGYFAGGAAGKVSLALSQKAWAGVTAAVGAGDAATVQVTKIAGTSVAGPITETWPIAQGSIRGTVFYESYNSTIAGGFDSVGNMKIQPGATQPGAQDRLRQRLPRGQRGRLDARRRHDPLHERVVRRADEHHDAQRRQQHDLHLRRPLPRRVATGTETRHKGALGGARPVSHSGGPFPRTAPHADTIVTTALCSSTS